MQLTKDDAVREEILESARDLFRQYGLTKTTMEDIARNTGKGKSTLYYYFANKDEIFEATLMQDMEHIFTATRIAVDKETTAEDKLKAFTLTRLKLLERQAALYSNVINGDITSNPKLLRKTKKEYEAKELLILESVLTYGIENNEFKKVDAEDIPALSYVMLTALRGIERSLLEDARISEMGERLHLILTVLANGMKA
jgi:AcrR family transcriptional regulator